MAIDEGKIRFRLTTDSDGYSDCFCQTFASDVKSWSWSWSRDKIGLGLELRGLINISLASAAAR